MIPSLWKSSARLLSHNKVRRVLLGWPRLSLMLAEIGGQQHFVQFNRIILRLKLKFLPQKNLQKLLSRAFKDEFLLMVLTKR